MRNFIFLTISNNWKQKTILFKNSLHQFYEKLFDGVIDSRIIRIFQ